MTKHRTLFYSKEANLYKFHLRKRMKEFDTFCKRHLFFCSFVYVSFIAVALAPFELFCKELSERTPSLGTTKNLSYIFEAITSIFIFLDPRSWINIGSFGQLLFTIIVLSIIYGPIFFLSFSIFIFLRSNKINELKHSFLNKYFSALIPSLILFPPFLYWSSSEWKIYWVNTLLLYVIVPYSVLYGITLSLFISWLSNSSPKKIIFHSIIITFLFGLFFRLFILSGTTPGSIVG